MRQERIEEEKRGEEPSGEDRKEGKGKRKREKEDGGSEDVERICGRVGVIVAVARHNGCRHRCGEEHGWRAGRERPYCATPRSQKNIKFAASRTLRLCALPSLFRARPSGATGQDVFDPPRPRVTN